MKDFRFTTLAIIFSCLGYYPFAQMKQRNDTLQPNDTSCNIFNIQRFNQNKTKDELSFLMPDSLYIRQYANAGNYEEVIYNEKTEVIRYKSFWSTGKIKSILTRFKNMEIGNTYYYDSTGFLINTINNEEKFHYNIEALKDQVKNFGAKISETSITRFIYPISYYVIFWKDSAGITRYLEIAGSSGKILKNIKQGNGTESKSVLFKDDLRDLPTRIDIGELCRKTSFEDDNYVVKISPRYENGINYSQLNKAERSVITVDWSFPNSLEVQKWFENSLEYTQINYGPSLQISNVFHVYGDNLVIAPDNSYEIIRSRIQYPVGVSFEYNELGEQTGVTDFSQLLTFNLKHVLQKLRRMKIKPPFYSITAVGMPMRWLIDYSSPNFGVSNLALDGKTGEVIRHVHHIQSIE